MSRSSYFNSCHIVVDIETLGTSNNAPVIEIGVAVLYQGKITKTIDLPVSLQSNIEAGMNAVDENTLSWWVNRQPQVLGSIISNSDKVTLQQALNTISELFDYLRKRYDVYFWSRGTNFDFPILQSAFEKFGINVPWKYWELRDIRTIDDPAFLDDYQFKPNNHYAIGDAINECEMLNYVLFGVVPNETKENENDE